MSADGGRCVPGCLSPDARSRLIQYRRRLQRRDVDGAIRRSRADGRRLDGERDGWKSRGPCRPVTGMRQQWPRSPLPALAAQGRRGGAGARPLASALEAELRRLREGPAQSGSQRTARVTRRRRRGCRKATRSGAGNRPPWLRSRRPRHPSHLAEASAGQTARAQEGACARRNADHASDGKCPSILFDGRLRDRRKQKAGCGRRDRYPTSLGLPLYVLGLFLVFGCNPAHIW